MKHYQTPEIEIEGLETEDIILSSVENQTPVVGGGGRPKPGSTASVVGGDGVYDIDNYAGGASSTGDLFGNR